MIDTSNSTDSIPFVAYGMIGITSLVLTYATLMDKGDKKEEGEPISSTSALPSLIPAPEEEVKPVPSELETVNSVTGLPIVPVSPIVPPPMDQLNKINEPENVPTENVPKENVPQAPVVGGKSRKSKKSKKQTKKHK
jgi:hypothetical protein